MTRAVTIAAMCLAAILLAACSAPPPPVGVSENSGTPTVYFKLCGHRVIGHLVVARLANSGSYNGPSAWTADLLDLAKALKSIPLATDVPGYRVSLGGGGVTDPTVRYGVTDATDSNGVNIITNVGSVVLRDLRPGLVLSKNKYRPAEQWFGPGGPKCH